MSKLPVKEGVGPVKTLNPQEKNAYHIQKFSQATSLSDLVEEYQFFTYAILFTYGKFDSDPVSDWITENNISEKPFAVVLPKLFNGLEKFNGILWACPKQNWEQLYKFMCGVGAINRSKKIYIRALVQKLPVPDVLALEKASVLPIPCPLIEIVAYGIDTNKNQVALQPANNPPLDLPSVVKLPARPETVMLAEALFNENQNPFNVVEKSPTIDELTENVSQKRKYIEVIDGNKNKSS